MTEKNVKKLKKWLNLQIKSYVNHELVMSSEKFRVANLSYYSEGIHISSNVVEIAEVLDLDVEHEPFSDEQEQISFTYNGVKFFALSKIDKGVE